jgi:signal peptidase I
VVLLAEKPSPLRAAWNKLKLLDPAEHLKRKYGLKGWKAELVDLVVGFAFAALLYYIILPAILGATPPAVVVQSCSMKGVLNVGDIVVLRGATFDEINAPLVRLGVPINFSLEPNDARNQTKFLVFPDNQTLPVGTSGDTVVYVSKTSGEQIVHRVIAKVEASDGRYYLTKGDANSVPDASKIDCAVWIGGECMTYSPSITKMCTNADKGWPGCIATPVKENEIAGRQIFVIPLLGHVKMLAFHVLTLGHGYPDKMWC